MRGKRVDTEFVSNYITDCVKIGCNTPDTIIEYTKKSIDKIDQQIKEVERQKALRCKLLDVLITFDAIKG